MSAPATICTSLIPTPSAALSRQVTDRQSFFEFATAAKWIGKLVEVTRLWLIATGQQDDKRLPRDEAVRALRVAVAGSSAASLVRDDETLTLITRTFGDWIGYYGVDGRRCLESSKSDVKDDAKRLLRLREGDVEKNIPVRRQWHA